MAKVGEDRDEQIDMRKKMEAMQKYIEVLEENVELRNTLPFHVKRLVTENENLKAEIQKLQEVQKFPTIRTSCPDIPASDLRNMINAYKLRNVKNIGDLAIFIQESKKQTLEPPVLIEINAILAHDLKKLQEDEKETKNLENQQSEVNGWEECDKAIIIHRKELSQTKINTEIMQQSLEEQLAEARKEKSDLEKTYRYAVHEIKKLQEKLANHHIENEDGQRKILSGESGIICDSLKSGQSIKFKNELMRMKKENIALAEKNSLSERTLATLQEEYESVLEKLDNCAEDNENLLEFNKSLKAQNQLFEREIGSSKMDCKRLQDKHQIFQSKEKDYQNRIKVFEKSKMNYDKINQVQNETIHKLKTSKSENNNLLLKLGQLKAICDTNEAEVARLETEKKIIEKRLVEANWEIEDLLSKLGQLKAICDTKETEVSRLETEKNYIENKLEGANWEMENLRQDCIDSQNLIAVRLELQESERKYFETRNVSLTNKLDEANCRILTLQTQISNFWEYLNLKEIMQNVEVSEIKAQTTSQITITTFKEDFNNHQSEKRFILIKSTLQDAQNSVKLTDVYSKSIMQWEPPMRFQLTIYVPTSFLEVWKKKKDPKINPVYDVCDCLQFFLSLYKPQRRALSVEKQAVFSDITKYFWRMKCRHLSFQTL